MIAPRGLVGLALAAWGWAIGFPALGIALGVLFEALRFVAPRLALSDLALARLLRVTFIAAIAAFAYSIATQRAPQSLYAWLRWLPIFFVPLPFLQVALGGELGVTALRQSLRFGGKPLANDPRAWDATHAYALCCLVAMGTSPVAERWYYVTAFGLIAWALVARMRARRIAGVALLICAAALAAGIATGLYRLQAQIEEWGEAFFEDMLAAEPDPFRERTRIGDMGRIKLNDRILMRAAPEGPRPEQILLREAAFDRYRLGTWEASRRTLAAVQREGSRWRLLPGEGASRVVVRRSFPRGEGLLALPAGAASLEHLEAAVVETSETGSVRVKGVDGPVATRVFYDDAAEAMRSPTDADLEVPPELGAMVESLVASERLRAASPAASIAAVERFFSGFAYTLQLSSSRQGRMGRTLTDFLLRDRKGHCEYFATATVLLLRQAGIPARYAVGYSAQEFSALEKAFVVRNRHAHAWAIAQVDGRWIVVDTTPANWAELESEAARSPFGALLDVASWAWESLSVAWARSRPFDLAVAIAILTLVVSIPAIARRLPRARRKGAGPSELDRVVIAWRQVEERAATLGHARRSGETVREWMARLRQDAEAGAWRTSLEELAVAYYVSLFDPLCPADARERFVERAREWAVQSAR